VSDLPPAGLPAPEPIRGWFAECDPCFQRELLGLAQPRFFLAGEVIFQAGDDGAGIFGVSCGVVALECRFTHPDAALVHMLRAGEWFGTVPLLVGKKRRFTATARTPVEARHVPGEEMRALLRRRPDWVSELGRDVVFSLDVAMQGATDLLIPNAIARCAAVLLRLGGRRWAGGGDADAPVDIPASQSELAMLCNVSRNTFGRVLKDFSAQSLVLVGYRSLTIVDPSRLRQIADAG
jgi:CRP-like cAMP-binding protein